MKYGIALCASILSTAVMLTSCSKPAQSAVESSNSSFDAELLFVDDQGCKIKRFTDAARHRYYAVCPTNLQVATDTSNGCGKNCTDDEQFPTVRGY